jgi:SAM-dependent methyltransferase
MPVANIEKGLHNQYRNILERILWTPFGMTCLEAVVTNRTATGWGRNHFDDAENLRISLGLQSLGMNVVSYLVDEIDWKDWIARATYDDFPNYMDVQNSSVFLEKSLEHFLAAQWLQLVPDDIYIDIASWISPVADIYHRLYGCTSFRQDLAFPDGIHGDVIGGDAAKMPVPDGFATKMALHCSFEHFEGDADIRFIQEAERVLKCGGILVIVPLYVAEDYCIHVDPVTWIRRRITFDSGATVRWVHLTGLSHSRHYDPEQFFTRIVKNSASFKVTILRVENLCDIGPACYAKFVAVLEKKY